MKEAYEVMLIISISLFIFLSIVGLTAISSTYYKRWDALMEQKTKNEIIQLKKEVINYDL